MSELKHYKITYPEEIIEDVKGIWCKSEDVKEIEEINKELIGFLINDYIACKDGQHPRHKDLKRFIEKIKQKPIEEIIK